MKLEEVWCGDMYTYVHTYTRNKENQENQEVKEELFILLENNNQHREKYVWD